jgi:hypothetical protein
LQKFS